MSRLFRGFFEVWEVWLRMGKIISPTFLKLVRVMVKNYTLVRKYTYACKFIKYSF